VFGTYLNHIQFQYLQWYLLSCTLNINQFCGPLLENFDAVTCGLIQYCAYGQTNVLNSQLIDLLELSKYYTSINKAIKVALT